MLKDTTLGSGTVNIFAMHVPEQKSKIKTSWTLGEFRYRSDIFKICLYLYLMRRHMIKLSLRRFSMEKI